MNPKLASIPEEFLWVHNRRDIKQSARARKLMKWCEEHGVRPTFAELEAE